MTICKVLGTDTQISNPIKFELLLDVFLKPQNSTCIPGQFNYIELICKNYNSSKDLMFAYIENRSDGVLFIGKWNDGIV